MQTHLSMQTEETGKSLTYQTVVSFTSIFAKGCLTIKDIRPARKQVRCINQIVHMDSESFVLQR